MNKLYYFLLMCVSVLCFTDQLKTGPLEIINDTNYNFLICDHQQVIVITSQQSYVFHVTSKQPLSFYISEQTNIFKMLCTVKEKIIHEQSIRLFLSDVIVHNFAIYPNLFFIQSNLEKQIAPAATSKPITCPTTDQDTQDFLNSIKQQQQIARESFKNNIPSAPVKPTRTMQENMAQKIAAVATSRQQQSVHQFARSSRRN